MLNPKVTEIVKNGTKEQRVYACSKSFPHFALYYFTEYFTYKIAPFHWDFYDDCQKLVDGALKEAAWIAFRESAKTSIAKIFIIWCIIYGKKHYINYDSYDESNAENALFDIAVALQTNKKILSDFGQLYFATKSGEVEKETKVKRKGNFVTEKTLGGFRVKVEAFSTQVPIRGRIYQNYRPDLVILDDIENNKTKDSYPAIISIRGHIDEMRTGLPEKSSVLYLGNLITEDGVIAYVMDILKNRENAVVRNIPAIMDGRPAWTDKYVLTDVEAIEANKEHPQYPKISLEAKRRELTSPVFEAEMMNNPAKVGDNIFDRNVINNAKKFCFEPNSINAGLKLWFDYNPSHRYGIGADTAEGIGRDSCASTIIDFSTIPARVVATYANSVIPPDLFGHELARQGKLFGECLIAPEVNNCFDNKTEVLTDSGWKLFGNLNKTETVATLNIDKDEIEFQKPTSYTERYEEKMYLGIQGHADFCVSLGHNMLIGRSENRNKFKLIPLEDLFNSNLVLKHSSTWKGKEERTFKIDNRNIKMDDWLEFLGILIADGNILKEVSDNKRQYYQITIAQSYSYPEKIEKIRDILNSMGFHFWERDQKSIGNYNPLKIFLLTNKELWKYLNANIGRGKTKKAPEFIKELSSRQIRIFLESFFMGDGYKRRKREKIYFPGLSKELADQLQELIIKTGNFARVKERKFLNNNYEVYEFLPCKTWLSGKDIKEIDYNDYAYCLSVPNKTLLVRRNGRPIFLGNTGYGTVAVLNDVYPNDKLFHYVTRDKSTGEELKKIGWHTNGSTKPSAIFELKSAIENGELEVYDPNLLDEMAYYQIRDLKNRKVEGMTRHFDLLMACAITWQLRTFSTPNLNREKEKEIQYVRQERRNEFFG